MGGDKIQALVLMVAQSFIGALNLHAAVDPHNHIWLLSGMVALLCAGSIGFLWHIMLWGRH